MTPTSWFVYKVILNYLLRQQALVTASLSKKIAVKALLRGSVISSVTAKCKGFIFECEEYVKNIIKESKALPLRKQT